MTEEAQVSGPTVMVAQSGNARPVPFEAGMTVAMALKAASMTVSGNQSVRVNNVTVTDMDMELAENSTILLVGNVSGA